MKRIYCEQGTEDWLNCRKGMTTASMFKACRDRYKTNSQYAKKGELKSESLAYAFGLAVERISGERLKEDKFISWEMKRGTLLEPDARMLHEIKIGKKVRQVGFAATDCFKFGCSLDGEIDDDGMAEYKCLTSPSGLLKSIYKNDPSDFYDQVQGGMWVCDKEWAHLVIYCEPLKCVDKELTILEAERDDEYIEGLVEDLYLFDKQIQYFVDFLKTERESEIIKLNEAINAK
jgi:hypothetical protein